MSPELKELLDRASAIIRERAPAPDPSCDWWLENSAWNWSLLWHLEHAKVVELQARVARLEADLADWKAGTPCRCRDTVAPNCLVHGNPIHRSNP